MWKRTAAVFVAIGFASQASAFTCFLTLLKNTCWKEYEVKIELIDAHTKKTMVKSSIPKGKLWYRTKFNCEAATSFNYTAEFTPTIWEADKGRVYKGKSTWSLPPKIEPGKTAWNVTICFPGEFSEVATPPTASGHCACSLEGVPAVVPPPAPE